MTILLITTNKSEHNIHRNYFLVDQCTAHICLKYAIP